MRGDDDYLLTGLCFAKLIDMDGNGVDELIIVDGNGIQFTDDNQLKDILTMQIWSYEDGAAQQLYEGKTLSGSYMDLGVCIMQRGDYYYVEVGNEETFSEYDITANITIPAIRKLFREC
jgi:hypothetical protein